MPQLDRALVKERAARLRQRGEILRLSHLDSMVGSQQTILVENNGFAHTNNFTLVAAPDLAPRTLAQVVITGHNGKHLEMQCLAAQAA
jgi:threonylcarbamoyladenosine tRNA methylthiotransferase MtaB